MLLAGDDAVGSNFDVLFEEGCHDFHETLAGGLISLKIFFSFFSLISFVRGSIRSLTPTDGSAIKRALATSMLV